MESLQSPRLTDDAGTAALAIRGSRVPALRDRNILPEAEIVDSFMAAVHDRAAKEADRAEFLAAVADLIDGILAGGNAARPH